VNDDVKLEKVEVVAHTRKRVFASQKELGNTLVKSLKIKRCIKNRKKKVQYVLKFMKMHLDILLCGFFVRHFS
jgi:hypothetical protein